MKNGSNSKSFLPTLIYAWNSEKLFSLCEFSTDNKRVDTLKMVLALLGHLLLLDKATLGLLVCDVIPDKTRQRFS